MTGVGCHPPPLLRGAGRVVVEKAMKLVANGSNHSAPSSLPDHLSLRWVRAVSCSKVVPERGPVLCWWMAGPMRGVGHQHHQHPSGVEVSEEN